MSRNVVKLKLDIIFKKMFADKAHESSLRHLLSSLLDIPYENIKKIEIKNTEILPDLISGKFSRLDLNMKLNDKLVNIEIQVKGQADFNDRTLFYWSKLYSGELKSGDAYSDLKESICINIINFNMFECEEYHSHFKVMEKDRHTVLSDKFAIHFFELKKINKNFKANSRAELWLNLINAETEEELDMLEQTNVKEIQEAIMIVREMNADERTREIARLREKALYDEVSNIASAERKGIEIGREQGAELEKIKRIKEMHRKNYDISAIADIYDISEDDVKSILNITAV